jgi:hypothetical protein
MGNESNNGTCLLGLLNEMHKGPITGPGTGKESINGGCYHRKSGSIVCSHGWQTWLTSITTTCHEVSSHNSWKICGYDLNNMICKAEATHSCWVDDNKYCYDWYAASAEWAGWFCSQGAFSVLGVILSWRWNRCFFRGNTLQSITTLCRPWPGLSILTSLHSIFLQVSLTWKHWYLLVFLVKM